MISALECSSRVTRRLGLSRPDLAPVHALHERLQLGPTKRDEAVLDRRPDEIALFESLCCKHEAGAIPYQELQAVAPLGPENLL